MQVYTGLHTSLLEKFYQGEKKNAVKYGSPQGAGLGWIGERQRKTPVSVPPWKVKALRGVFKGTTADTLEVFAMSRAPSPMPRQCCHSYYH